LLLLRLGLMLREGYLAHKNCATSQKVREQNMKAEWKQREQGSLGNGRRSGGNNEACSAVGVCICVHKCDMLTVSPFCIIKFIIKLLL